MKIMIIFGLGYFDGQTAEGTVSVCNVVVQ